MPIKCQVAYQESALQNLTAAIFASSLLRNGSIVDCGAHVGGESCFYAQLDPQRTVAERGRTLSHLASHGLARRTPAVCPATL